MDNSIILNGLTVEQLSQILRDIVREELAKLPLTPQPSRLILYTRKEAAELLRVSTTTLTNWVNKGKITATKICGHVLFRQSDIERALVEIVPFMKRPHGKRKK